MSHSLSLPLPPPFQLTVCPTHQLNFTPSPFAPQFPRLFYSFCTPSPSLSLYLHPFLSPSISFVLYRSLSPSLSPSHTNTHKALILSVCGFSFKTESSRKGKKKKKDVHPHPFLVQLGNFTPTISSLSLSLSLSPSLSLPTSLSRAPARASG